MHIMRGRFGRQPTLPASPGIECVGVVEALGSGVAGPAPGTSGFCRWRVDVGGNGNLLRPWATEYGSRAAGSKKSVEIAVRRIRAADLA